MLVFFTLWYIFTAFSYGVEMPSGLLVPGLICGCAVGSLYNTLRIQLFGLQIGDYSTAPVLVGAAAMLASYTHMTFSLIILMMETTNSFNLFIPYVVAVLVSRSIG